MPVALGSKLTACALAGCLVLASLPAFAEAPTAAPAPPATSPAEPAPPVAATPSAPPEAVPTAAMPASPPADFVVPAPAEAPPPPAPPAAVEMLPPTPPPDAAPPPPSKVPSYILWGVGGASIVVGAAFGIAALTEKSRFDDNPSYGKANAVHGDTVVSDAGLGLGVVLLVGGTVFYFVDDKDSSSAQQTNHANALASVSIAPIIGQSTHGGTVTLRF
jgi:hypothetical protein